MEVATALVSASIKLSESAVKDSTSARSRGSSISEGGVSWFSLFSLNKEGSRQAMERDIRRDKGHFNTFSLIIRFLFVCH